MVVILYQHGCQKIAEKTAADLLKVFSKHVQVNLVAASSSASWPAEASWDDLLIVMFNGRPFPARGISFISQYMELRADSPALLPVSTDRNSKRPPAPAAAIKALEYDRSAKGERGRLANRVGAMLGLRVQGRDANIFISYRAADGTKLAKQLHKHLVSLGRRAYLDEAKEFDGEPYILPGSPVQKQIDEALGNANLVLLVDTPKASESPWIKHEVETADGLLLPVLPLCFRDKDDPKVGPRFPSLLSLQRWVSLQTPDPTANPPLNAGQLDNIVSAADTFACEMFRRKCKVPFLAKREFVSHGFAWKVLDKRLLMFESSKSLTWRVPTKVLSHCSVFDQVYGPALRRFVQFLGATARCNHSLFIYDGVVLPDTILREIAEEAKPEPVIILHHQELAALIDSNFTTLGAA
jgi:TIR domain